jgi:hypothetical protein
VSLLLTVVPGLLNYNFLCLLLHLPFQVPSLAGVDHCSVALWLFRVASRHVATQLLVHWEARIAKFAFVAEQNRFSFFSLSLFKPVSIAANFHLWPYIFVPLWSCLWTLIETWSLALRSFHGRIGIASNWELTVADWRLIDFDRLTCVEFRIKLTQLLAHQTLLKFR